ncbi:MAG TPA: thiopurine S-methyltransferase [Cellvibrionaceae bacterium]|nr:thiopurine S-methyltransferase [Cellvibrionaceae bacterium]HMW72258.1 thiopurine S-methyltransferase [Cellvibrionaceae bacterium]HMY39974.1 thiopurine S-methyltransferase [Marinagarivorans sp.]HNG60392.1 thiopurine S-methyltransferase [Cellvibrionaceae bacterium]
MDADFWQQKWHNNDIGFHQSEGNPLFIKYFNALGVPPGGRIFLPLCGKTRDIAWLLSQGYKVVGAELSALAIEQLFAELGVQPTRAYFGNVVLYRAPNIDIFVGDIFALTHLMLGKVDAIYDRAALVALPENKRKFYSSHLIDIAARVPQLLICFEYDQSQMPGPPFAILEAEVKSHYQQYYGLTLLEKVPVEGGLKGSCEALEVVWLLKTK